MLEMSAQHEAYIIASGITNKIKLPSPWGHVRTRRHKASPICLQVLIRQVLTVVTCTAAVFGVIIIAETFREHDVFSVACIVAPINENSNQGSYGDFPLFDGDASRCRVTWKIHGRGKRSNSTSNIFHGSGSHKNVGIQVILKKVLSNKGFQ